MLQEFPRVGRQALLARLAEGHAARITVVTPNRRLARSLQLEFDAGRAGAGLAAWESADILPFTAFLERLWDDALYSPLAPDLPLLLSLPQQQVLWEETLRATPLAGSLLSSSWAARQCREAWQLAHEWKLVPRLFRAPLNEDAQAFIEWSEQYRKATRERRQTDHARLPDLLGPLLPGEALRKPQELVLFGFHTHVPQQQEFLEALAATGTRILAGVPDEGGSKPARLEFNTPGEELSMAARWARSRLEANPAARIGLVVPDLTQSRARVRRSLAAVLSPSHLLEGAGETALPFDISAPPPLVDYPLVRDALRILRLAGPEIPFEEASALLRSPYIAGAESELAVRARADARLRRRLGASLTLDALIHQLSGERVASAPILIDRLERLSQHRKSRLFTAKGPADWARAVLEALEAMGFPGDRTLDSNEYQTLAKWHEALAQFATLERVAGSLRYAQACRHVAAIATDTPFQPESAEVPILVLGTLESAGLAFDHLWVSGLTDEAWPPPPRPNPLLPLSLQKQAGIPQADTTASLEWDRRITEGWIGSAPEVVFSHARMKEDSELSVSPLIASVPMAGAEALGIARFETLREALHRHRVLERVADSRGPSVLVTDRAGGTSLFRDQAACPFRAFARHRLASEPLEHPQPGLDARDRGTLLHQMLAATWRRIGTKARLDAIAPTELDAVLAESVAEAIAYVKRYRADALSGRFESIERQRLVRITREWLGIERARTGFEVVAIEEKRPMTFGGITVHARLDRMDRLSQGGHAIIDYKAGEAAVRAWLGPRPEEPQLPMYALAAPEDIRAAAFARMKPGSLEFCGIAMEEGLLPGVTTIDRHHGRQPLSRAYPDWTALTRGWRRELEALGRGFAQGEASVSPKRPETCKQCHQSALCRVAEKMPAAAVADAADDAEAEAT